MSTIKVIVIPADKDQPVRLDSYDTSNYKNLTKLIFGSEDGTFDRMVSTDPHDGEVTLWFDDNGLTRLDHEDINDVINLRAMELFAHLEGAMELKDYGVPLIGDYVITGGADDEGESLDAPLWIMDFPFSWHTRYTLHSRKEGFD
jgi:hypothetical protein